MSDSASGLNERALRLSESLDDFETDAGVSDDDAGAGAGSDAGAGADEDAVFSPMADADDPASFSPTDVDGDVGSDAAFSPDALPGDETVDRDGGRNGDGATFSPESAADSAAGSGSESSAGTDGAGDEDEDEDEDETAGDAEDSTFGFGAEDAGR
jgi:hypothetical protein